MEDKLPERVSGLEARVGNLEGWQRTQNGTLRHLDKKIDSNLKWTMGVGLTALLNLLALVVAIYSLIGGGG